MGLVVGDLAAWRRAGAGFGGHPVRPLLVVVPRLGGGILLSAGLYVAYYGWYELRLAGDLRRSGRDPSWTPPQTCSSG